MTKINVVRLFEAEFLDRARRLPFVARLRVPMGLGAAVALKAGAFSLVALVLYLPPLLVPRGALSSLPPFLASPESVVNLGSAFFFYLGLLAGGCFLIDQVVGPNERILAFPITIRDLARFRLADDVRSAISAAVFLVLPWVSLSYLAAGWRPAHVALVLATDLLAFVALFLGGAVAMLFLLARLPRARPETVFLSIFLSSVWVFVAVLDLPRWKGAVALDAAVSQALSAVACHTLPALMARFASAAAPFVVLVAAYQITLLAFLVALLLAADRALTAAYRRVHRVDCGHAAAAALDASRPGYVGIARVLDFLPPATRALLARDIVSVLRRPFLLVRIAGVALPLLLLPVLASRTVREPAILGTYFFSAFLAVRLFLDAGSHDFEIGLPLRHAFASGARYLAARWLIVSAATTIIIVPVFLVIARIAGWGGASGGRALLVLANVLCASLCVVPFSMLTSGFRRGGWRASGPEAHPSAMLLFWFLGSAGPYVFYRLDGTLRGVTSFGAQGVIAATVLIVSCVILNVLATAIWGRRTEALAGS